MDPVNLTRYFLLHCDSYEAVHKRFADRFSATLGRLPGVLEIEPGWRPLVWEMLERIEKIVMRDNLEVDTILIKEKFGGLRVRCDIQTDEVSKLVKNTIVEAEKTCELCAQPGCLCRKETFRQDVFTGFRVTEVINYWYKTLCPIHALSSGYEEAP
jgi:hypothetical protein